MVTHTPEVAEQFSRVERLEDFNQAVAAVTAEVVRGGRGAESRTSEIA